MRRIIKLFLVDGEHYPVQGRDLQYRPQGPPYHRHGAALPTTKNNTKVSCHDDYRLSVMLHNSIAK